MVVMGSAGEMAAAGRSLFVSQSAWWADDWRRCEIHAVGLE